MLFRSAVDLAGGGTASAETDSSGNVIFTITDGAAGDVISVTISVSSDNYDPAEVSIILTLAEKKSGTLAVTQDDFTYGGTIPAAVPDPGPPEGITPGFSYSGTDVFGTDYGPSPDVPANAGSYTVTVTYETADTIWTGTDDFSVVPASVETAEVSVTGTYRSEEHTV